MSDDPKCRCGAYARPELSDPRPDGIGGPLCSYCYDNLPWDEIEHPELFGEDPFVNRWGQDLSVGMRHTGKFPTRAVKP